LVECGCGRNAEFRQPLPPNFSDQFFWSLKTRFLEETGFLIELSGAYGAPYINSGCAGMISEETAVPFPYNKSR